MQTDTTAPDRDTGHTVETWTIGWIFRKVGPGGLHCETQGNLVVGDVFFRRGAPDDGDFRDMGGAGAGEVLSVFEAGIKHEPPAGYPSSLSRIGEDGCRALIDQVGDEPVDLRIGVLGVFGVDGQDLLQKLWRIREDDSKELLAVVEPQCEDGSFVGVVAGEDRNLGECAIETGLGAGGDAGHVVTDRAEWQAIQLDDRLDKLRWLFLNASQVALRVSFAAIESQGERRPPRTSQTVVGGRWDKDWGRL